MKKAKYLKAKKNMKRYLKEHKSSVVKNILRDMSDRYYRIRADYRYVKNKL